MTFSKLETLIKKYNIPKNVVLMSNSGWGCNATEMDGVYYCKEENLIHFTQDFDNWEYEESGLCRKRVWIPLKLIKDKGE